ncbi:hypothetical protein Tco_0467692 [Tanacetum coccineum]
MQAAQDRQKSYADRKRNPMEFKVGDRVMLKVSPWKGVVRFGKRGKLNPRYVRPFKVLAKVGKVAYKLELPQQLSRVHHTFHVSNLKKCYADEPIAMPLEGIHIDNKLQFVEELVEIMEREIKRLKRNRIPLVKIVREICEVFVDLKLAIRQDLGFIPSGNVVLSSTYVGKILGADQLLVILCYRYQESGIGYWILSMTISGSGVSTMRLGEVDKRDRRSLKFICACLAIVVINKRRNQQNDKTEHGMEKNVAKSRPKSQKIAKVRVSTKESAVTGAGTEESFGCILYHLMGRERQ